MSSNEQAKQQAIIKAWGECWEKLSEGDQGCALRSDGYVFDIDGSNSSLLKRHNIAYITGRYYTCPRALRGLEDNLGWVKIEPDGSNIPEEIAYYEVCINGIPWGHPQPLQFLVKTFHSPAKEQLTHFRKWRPSPGPIY